MSEGVQCKGFAIYEQYLNKARLKKNDIKKHNHLQLTIQMESHLGISKYRAQCTKVQNVFPGTAYFL